MADLTLEQMLAAYAADVIATKAPTRADYVKTEELLGKPFTITAITQRDKYRAKNGEQEWCLTIARPGAPSKLYTLGCNMWRDKFMQSIGDYCMTHKVRVTLAYGIAPGGTKSSLQIVKVA